MEQNAAAGEDPAVLAEEIALGNIFLFPDEPAAASDVIPVDNPEPASEPAVTEAPGQRGSPGAIRRQR